MPTRRDLLGVAQSDALVPGAARADTESLPAMEPLENDADLETLSRICADERRWEFLDSVVPWRFLGANSSPVNGDGLMRRRP